MSIPKFITNCQEGVYEQRFVVEEREVDANGAMQWGALARRMQTMTEKHLEVCGLDLEELMASGKTWIISWSGMNIHRLPKVGENIILRIWPSNRKMLMHTRKYGFYTTEGETLLSVASIFMLMDLKARCAVDTGTDFPEIPVVILEEEPVLPKMRLPFPKEFSRSTKRIVDTNEIDYNGHMNNSHYLDWSQSVTKVKDKEPRYIWIQYNKELLEGDTADILYEWRDADLFGKICNNGEDAFVFKISF